MKRLIFIWPIMATLNPTNPNALMVKGSPDGAYRFGDSIFCYKQVVPMAHIGKGLIAKT